MTTRIITFLIGNPYKPSFPTVTGRGHTQSIQMIFIDNVKYESCTNVFPLRFDLNSCMFDPKRGRIFVVYK